jgi:hypothetical protein
MRPKADWIAHRLEVKQDGGVLVVALSEDDKGSGRVLVFQRAVAAELIDEDDPDTYSMSDEMGTTVYGGVQAIQLDAGALLVEFDAAAALFGLERLRIGLAIGRADVRALEAGLRMVFAGSPSPPRFTVSWS